jgi:hypothetical protein
MLKQEVTLCCTGVRVCGMGNESHSIDALNSTHYNLLIQTLGLYNKQRKTDVPRSYASVLKEYILWPMEAEVKWRHLTWVGSVLRMNNDRLPRKMMFGELVDGKKSIGGQTTQWNRWFYRT